MRKRETEKYTKRKRESQRSTVISGERQIEADRESKNYRY